MFTTYLVNPLYNGFVALLDILPTPDAGVGVILFTIIVSAALYPLSKKALVTQVRMRMYEGEMAEVKEKYKNNKEEQARQLLAFYKQKGINPFSSIFLVILQIPIIIALYYVFLHAGLPEIDAARLYSFVPVPEAISMKLFGLFDIAGKNIILALLAGAAQFIQGWFSPTMAASTAPKKNTPPSFEESLASSMRVQTRYFLPLIIILISYQYSGVIALYFMTRSLFMFGQELAMKPSRTTSQIQTI